ncbi:MAG: hypothetical protein HYR51_16680 [Candidatus Rokubacteria bacterium]|nr:hypothetical protein [Candidatus Rokubacteria bacterium]
MRLASLVALLTLALPRLALACASCISSPYGDRSYNLAYIGLILTPFALMLAIGGVFTGCWWAQRRSAGPTRRRRHAGDDDSTDPLNEETT